MTEVKPRKKLTIHKKLLIITLSITSMITIIALFAYSRYLHPTGEIKPGIYAVKTGGNGAPLVNFFLMSVDDGYIAFDSGVNNARTKNELQKLNISADEVVAVFITHGDHDHIGSLNLFNNAIIYTGPIELSDYSHEILSDGDVIDTYGVSIQILYTPGHTSGCAIYLVDGKFIFAGDLFINPNKARYDAELQKSNIEKALGINDVEYIFTGHFGLFKDIRMFRWLF